MKSTGYIKNGKYIKAEPIISDMKDTTQRTWKNADHEKQRREHARDMIQPRDYKGNPNKEFIQEYPEEAKTYGLI